MRLMLALITLTAIPVAVGCYIVATKLPALLAARAAMLGGY